MRPSAPPWPPKRVCGSVLVVEKAPEYFRGGNTYFTGGIIRFSFDGIEDIKALIPDMSPTEEASVDVGSYPQNQFYDDMMRVTHGLSDPELAQILVSQSFPTMKWLRGKGSPVCPVFRPPGVQRRRQIPVLGRAAGGSRGGRKKVFQTSNLKRAPGKASRSVTPPRA